MGAKCRPGKESMANSHPQLWSLPGESPVGTFAFWDGGPARQTLSLLILILILLLIFPGIAKRAWTPFGRVPEGLAIPEKILATRRLAVPIYSGI